MLAPMERQNYNRAIRQYAKVYGIWVRRNTARRVSP